MDPNIKTMIEQRLIESGEKERLKVLNVHDRVGLIDWFW